MQGFNKYYPPDYDGEKHKSLNSYRGKHALGDRARKIDQGILITRFELPFNIWCSTCDNHIGMGVRYNAEKRKIGMYYSSPIFAFRCKCHLCSGWFEIHTDPKNTRYVVVSGARKKDEDWNPEENGGYAIHENDPSKAGPSDPLASLEKTTAAETHATQVAAPRIETLQGLSDHLNSDPYTLSSRLRRSFREEKKVITKKREADDKVKEQYGLPRDLVLLDADDSSLKEEASRAWAEERGSQEQSAKRRRVAAETGVSNRSLASASSGATSSRRPPRLTSSSAVLRRPPIGLAANIIGNTTRKLDPFLSSSAISRKNGLQLGVSVRK